MVPLASVEVAQETAEQLHQKPVTVRTRLHRARQMLRATLEAEIAGSFGKGIKEFKKNMNDVQREIATPAEREALPPAAPRDAVQHDDSPAKEPRRLM